jgi:hypothetical protein
MSARTLIDRPKDSIAHVDYKLCLYIREELRAVLNLSPEQIGRRIDTGQLTAILVYGEERFDSREVCALIDTYIRCHASASLQIPYRTSDTSHSYIGDRDGPVIQGSYRLAESDRADGCDLQTH